MGTFIGHVLPGAGFLLLGLWHLFNTIGAHVRSPWHFKTRTWFPLKYPRLRHVELYFIMLGSCLSIAAELFICPAAHQPWADDWSIPANHLNNFEHSTISLFMFIYAASALVLDLTRLHVPQGWLHGLAAVAFSQELLLFHFHSSDHMGLEGHFHLLLQLPIMVGILTLLVEISIRNLPAISIFRSMSIVFQGTWFIQMGFVLWTPSLLPKDCAMVHTPDHATVECSTHDALHQAKALANLQFSWHLAALVVLTGALFFLLSLLEKRRMTYQHLAVGDDHSEVHSPSPFKVVDDEDIERGNSPTCGGSQTSMELQTIYSLNLER
ncbi:uncharacterized protein [Physcomitrium patens]|uniref:Transmembrane protein 45B n=1 Tax=Physcomitrium patens TaxID=3218 RepID=A9S9U9_PHYPA|nr:transmembrane protein 45B-like [Physcomitrium patens]PNR62725.1 hypothetical protein PHYPA_001149 [Physcomitrium patens]|eukprot:XP_024395018.1 transmembrane protein 45B-like [Physcomitrella patens]